MHCFAKSSFLLTVVRISAALRSEVTPCLPRYLYGKRAAGYADGEGVERLHPLGIVEHRTVDQPVRFISELLEVMKVGGDDTEAPFAVKTLQQGLRHRAAYLWLCTAAKLIDKDKGAVVTMLDRKSVV